MGNNCCIARCLPNEKICPTPIKALEQLSEGATIVNNTKPVGSLKLQDNFTFEILIDDPTVIGNIDISINSEDWILDPKIGLVFRGEDGKFSYKMVLSFSSKEDILLDLNLSIRETKKNGCGILERKEIAKINLEIPDVPVQN